MNYFEIATVSYFTNVPKGHFLSEEEAEFVASQVVELFVAKLKKSPFSGDLVIIRAEYDIARIITTITIGTTIAAIYKFIKSYPTFRPGLVLLLRDLNGVLIKLKHRGEKETTWIYDDETPSQSKLESVADKASRGEMAPAKVDRRLTRRSSETPREHGAAEL